MVNQSATDHAPESTAQGGARLLASAAAFVEDLVRTGPQRRPCPTVSTRKGTFAPVLTDALLSRHPELHTAMLAGNPQLQRAHAFTEILEALRSGEISHPTALRTALIARIMRPFRMDADGAKFDLLYAALQLTVLHRDSESEAQYEELFQLAVNHVYSLVSIESTSLSYGVEHFLAHAAIFLSLGDANDLWVDVIQRAGIWMEQWGMAPPPEGVFTHCALNLSMVARRMPTNDLPYDLVKHLRSRVAKKEIEATHAFEALTLTLGWRLASSLMRVLWNEVLDEYNQYERAVASRAIEADIDDGWRVAKKRGFCSELGVPFVRTDRPLTAPNEFALSFPGGWTIGGTSVVCKAGRLRILLDCGATTMGAAGGNDPELDLVDCVLVSHAHQDHIGGLLELYREGRFNGPWYATRQTGVLGRLTLQDSVRLHKEAYGFNGIYDEVLLENVMEKFIPVDYGVDTVLDPEISVKAFPAGHVPGSCQWQIRNAEKRFLFSGDMNLRQNLSDATVGFEFPTEQEIESTIAIAVEGTYAFSQERILENAEAREDLLERIRTADSRPVLVPVLSLGRAQEVCAALSGTGLRVGVFGLAARMTRAVSRLLRDNVVFDERRPELVKRGDYDVLVASSGCLQGGPSRVFYESSEFKGVPVILTGHIFPGTPAKAIMERVPRVRFSAHVTPEDWRIYVGRYEHAKRFIVHLPAWPGRLELENAVVPRRHSEYSVGSSSEAKNLD
jgi:Cft2 family RNA processing exonuclease